MEVFQIVLLDLVSDSSNNTVQQLKNHMILQQDKNVWPASHHALWEQTDNTDKKHNQQTVSSLISYLFNAKTIIDEEKTTNFVFVTSWIFKKFWEEVCFKLFSPVHNWMVFGVNISDQYTDNLVDVSEIKVEDELQKFLMTVGNPEHVEVLRPKVIPLEIFNAGFSTRKGGVSSLAPMASLNLMYSLRKVDPVAVIEENTRRLAVTAGFDPSAVYMSRVEHGKAVRIVDSNHPGSSLARYDGLVTNTPGVTLIAPGADCCPILLADPKTGACGAVHSGWMGTALGAVRETLRAMVEEYGTDPADVKAAIGPSVETKCFRIPSSQCKPLRDLDPSLTPVCEDAADQVNTDLVRANAIMLERDGVLPENIDTSRALCTKCNPELFFSHQRTGFPFGNHVGFISCVKS